MSRFSDEEIVRYGRQMVLPEVGGVGQERIRAVRAIAHGEIEALYLAAAGVGVLTVPSETLASAARALNPAVEVRVVAGEVSASDAQTQSLRALAVLKEALGL